MIEVLEGFSMPARSYLGNQFEDALADCVLDKPNRELAEYALWRACMMFPFDGEPANSAPLPLARGWRGDRQGAQFSFDEELAAEEILSRHLPMTLYRCVALAHRSGAIALLARVLDPKRPKDYVAKIETEITEALAKQKAPPPGAEARVPCWCCS